VASWRPAGGRADEVVSGVLRRLSARCPWTPLTGRARPASRKAGRRSGRADGETRLIIIPDAMSRLSTQVTGVSRLLAPHRVFETRGIRGHAGPARAGGPARSGRPGMRGHGLVLLPHRLARKFAYQALLIEELARAGVRVEFVKGKRGDSPGDQAAGAVPGHVRRAGEAQLMGPRCPPPRVGERAVGRPFGYWVPARASAPGVATRSPGTSQCWSLRCSAARRRRVCGPALIWG